MEVLNWLIDWFVKNSSIDKNHILNNLTENYLEIGWIDSLNFISLITDIEDTFKIHFSNESFQDRDFSTISGLQKIIEELRNGKV